MADTQQVRVNYRNEEEEESPDPDTSPSRRRRFKATNMSFGEMVDILMKADYDGKYGPYPNPNIRKAKIIAKVVKREKRLGGHPSSEETRDPPPLEEGEIPPTQAEQEEEKDVVEIGTTTGDRDVVDRVPFTSESAQILIGEIMGCNLELENLKKKINDVIQKNNIIDVLGRI
ncbi:hypothetical protein AB205_0073500 [Aquarana catesbeiana]|uniref:Uncharacterized protein n=1 Tax=Aquarana catesbeiana TaxID=8400 RepID=A0A2G9Q5E6_AQUCT|nr:hypothetical protein AB205_0158150 [Aquarana catesbeiana]PIO36214.1 hypothetical protein AB205_0073500 [Aquarana catesbeiana]